MKAMEDGRNVGDGEEFSITKTTMEIHSGGEKLISR
jgi:hypothetical protein